MGALKLFPLLVIVALLSFSVRLSELVIGISNISNTAYAKEKEYSDKKPKPKDDSSNNKKESKNTSSYSKYDNLGAKDGNNGEGNNKDKINKDIEVVKDENVKTPKWRDASDADTDVAAIKFELFKDLAKRRKQLDKQEKDLKVREALLKAAEHELDRKYQELEKLRGEIEALLKKQSDEENQRINSLVKIYEGMKPKDAARIFDTLDLDVLISVISKMSERKVSPILAAMNPERVRTVTIMLAEQKTLPTLR